MTFVDIQGKYFQFQVRFTCQIFIRFRQVISPTVFFSFTAIIKYNEIRRGKLLQYRRIQWFMVYKFLVFSRYIEQISQWHIGIVRWLMLVQKQTRIHDKRQVILHSHIYCIFQCHNLQCIRIFIITSIHRIVQR